MNLEEYKQKYDGEDASPGWGSIDYALSKLYENQEPKHWAPDISHMLGGENPLDGMRLYKSNSGNIDHFHIVTYGFSELYYSEKSFSGEFSKFGFELTFRLKPYPLDGD